MSREIIVVKYSCDWPKSFETESALLRPVFADLLVETHHIGSTAVPGLAAKPVIDILAVVRDTAPVKSLILALEALGYTARGERGIPGRCYFTKGAAKRTHQLHVFGAGSREIKRHLAFRDYLRSCPEVAAEYGALKERLAKNYRYWPAQYSAGKEAFVKRIEAKALAFYFTSV